VVVHGLRSGQQQRNHTSEIHTASAVLSRKERCLLDEMQASTTTVAPHQPSQDADSQLLLCGHCRQIARFTCAACHNEWYCSGECQVSSQSLEYSFSSNFTFIFSEKHKPRLHLSLPPPPPPPPPPPALQP
jgi:hypothetical protein